MEGPEPSRAEPRFPFSKWELSRERPRSLSPQKVEKVLAWAQVPGHPTLTQIACPCTAGRVGAVLAGRRGQMRAPATTRGWEANGPLLLARPRVKEAHADPPAPERTGLPTRQRGPGPTTRRRRSRTQSGQRTSSPGLPRVLLHLDSGAWSEAG